jgi:hypothetical protein
VRDEAAAAQRELDEFFGVQFAGESGQSTHSPAPSVLAGATTGPHDLHARKDDDPRSDAPSVLSHVDDSGRASMVEVGQVCVHYFKRRVLLPAPAGFPLAPSA